MILIDTCYVIDLLRKKIKVSSLEQYTEEILFVSDITRFELYFGIFSNKELSDNIQAHRKRINKINTLLAKFQTLSFEQKAAIEAAKILGTLELQGMKIDFRDGLIAGTGLANGINKILTRNMAHFDRIPRIKTCQYELV